MDVKLVVKKGSTRKRVLQLRSEETIVGRRQDCDLRIESSAVSRRHCLLRFQAPYLVVEDLDSVNGTYVNGKRVKSKQVVNPGDRLDVGPLAFIVEYDLPRTAKKAAAEDDDALDVLPLADDDLQTAQLDALEADTAEGDASASILEALEVSEGLENDAAWHLPESNDLREILSEMDMEDPESKLR
jgi:pSer/pThr/pTyr-binding forkhead associated (FHA) protein